MSDQLTQIYGRGWAFPPIFTPDGVCMAEGAEDVRQSMQILFSTQPGERIMRESFGCDLQPFMFANINNALLSDIEAQIRDSVLYFEPRAQIVSVMFGQEAASSGVLTIQVIYRLRGNNMDQQLAGQVDVAQGQVLFR